MTIRTQERLRSAEEKKEEKADVDVEEVGVLWIPVG